MQKFKKLEEYNNLSEVPLEHPEIKCICGDSRVTCSDAIGQRGCLARDHHLGSCIMMYSKKTDKSLFKMTIE